MSDRLEIVPLTQPPHATVRVPGSKSITNRALVLAALSGKGTDCILRGALQSEDTEVMIAALRQLGFHIDAVWGGDDPYIAVSSDEGILIPASGAELYVANSGTTMRFLTAMVCLGNGRYRIDGVPRMRERPIEDLLATLRQLGVRASSEAHNGCPPVVIQSDSLKGGMARIKGNVSSQFLSGLLLAAPFAQEEIMIEVDGPLVSWPYVAMTIEMMRQWFFRIDMISQVCFRVPGRQWGGRCGYDIEPDATAATYFWAQRQSPTGMFGLPASTRAVFKVTSALSKSWRKWAARSSVAMMASPSTAPPSTASTWT